MVLATPMLGSKMRRHIMPTATGVATSGSRIATRTQRSPLKGRRSSSAMTMPKMTSTMSTTTVNSTVRQTAGQNRSVSVSISVKFSKPMKSRLACTESAGVGEAEVGRPREREDDHEGHEDHGRGGEEPLAVGVGPLGEGRRRFGCRRQVAGGHGMCHGDASLRERHARSGWSDQPHAPFSKPLCSSSRGTGSSPSGSAWLTARRRSRSR